MTLRRRDVYLIFFLNLLMTDDSTVSDFKRFLLVLILVLLFSRQVYKSGHSIALYNL